MQELTMQEIDDVSGGLFFGDYLLGKAIDWAVDAVLSGKVDYSSLAVSSGSSYNMLGA